MPKTANEQLQNLQTKNQHLTEAYKTELSTSLMRSFRSMERKILKEITIFYDPETTYQKDKTVLLKKIREIQEIELNKIKEKLLKGSEKYLGTEASIYKKQLESTFKDVEEFIHIKSVDPASLKKAYEKAKITMDKGETYTLASLWRTFYNSVVARTIQNTESAYALEKTTKEYSSDIKTGFKTNENSLVAVTAVAIQQAYSIAMREMDKANEFLVKGYLWNSVIDSSTSPFCIDHAYQYWIYNHPELSTLPYEIYVPAHFRCRSTNPPITKSYQELGLDPDSLTASQKTLLAGGVPQTQSYTEWFEGQSDKVQREVLGATRYTAYKNGSIKINSFTSNGQRLTIKQLEKAGYDI